VVEPVTLGAIVAALVARALNRAEDKVLDESAGGLGRLVSLLRRRLSEDSDREGSAALERLVVAPHSETLVRDFAVRLDERLDGDQEFRAELEACVNQARRTGIDVDEVSQVAMGQQIVQNVQVVDSQITVSYTAKPGGDGAAG
jgi:hypothetical protein